MSEPVQPESRVALMVPADSELIVRETTMSAFARDRLAAIRTWQRSGRGDDVGGRGGSVTVVGEYIHGWLRASPWTA